MVKTEAEEAFVKKEFLCTWRRQDLSKQNIVNDYLRAKKIGRYIYSRQFRKQDLVCVDDIAKSC